MSTIIVTENDKALVLGSPVARFAGPPADRMNGRNMARAKRATMRSSAATKPKGTPKANATLSGDQTIDQAIHQGIIGANMAAHFKVLWQADPDDTRKYLEKLGLIPDMGLNPDPSPEQIVKASSVDDSFPAEMLLPSEQKRIAAAREGRHSSRFVNGGL
jgi:hypothetical protein